MISVPVRSLSRYCVKSSFFSACSILRGPHVRGKYGS